MIDFHRLSRTEGLSKNFMDKWKFKDFQGTIFVTLFFNVMSNGFLFVIVPLFLKCQKQFKIFFNTDFFFWNYTNNFKTSNILQNHIFINHIIKI